MSKKARSNFCRYRLLCSGLRKIIKTAILKNRFIFILFFAIIIFNIFGALYLSSGNADAGGYDSKGKRDPFMPLVTVDGRIIELEAAEPGLKEIKLRLEGIMYSPSGLSAAVVNGLIVKIGDILPGGFKLVNIQPKKIILMPVSAIGGDNQKLELKLREEK